MFRLEACFHQIQDLGGGEGEREEERDGKAGHAPKPSNIHIH